MSDLNTLMRSIPAMDEILSLPWAGTFSALVGREYVKKIISQTLSGIRDEISCGKLAISGGDAKNAISAIAANRAIALLEKKSSSSLESVVNATGVIIHTNLGRAPLAEDAVKAVQNIAASYSTLEYSKESGARGGRNSHIEWLICHITGAEAALVVNNNAAAVLLALTAAASGREVIVSNGELVEIGDSFRIPDILSFSGAAMVAVGCTNSSRISDYRKAITEKTAVLLKVHPSNYRIQGFTAAASREELAELASSQGLVFMEDLGSGLLCSLGIPFANMEHSVRDCLQAGAGLVTFSGDKLLGGPQIGVAAGSKAVIDKMRSHQLLRALRVDKMTLAAFEATLRMYITERQREIPVINMIEADAGALRKKAQRLCRALEQKARSIGADDVTVTTVQTEDAIGGGAFPTDILHGFGAAIRSASTKPEILAASLRTGAVPVIPGIQDGQVVLHVRTLLAGDEQKIAETFAGALSASGKAGA